MFNNKTCMPAYEDAVHPEELPLNKSNRTPNKCTFLDIQITFRNKKDKF